MDFLNENMNDEFSIVPAADDGSLMYVIKSSREDAELDFTINDDGYVKVILIVGRDLGVNGVAGEEIGELMDPSVEGGILGGSIIMNNPYYTDKIGVITKEDSDQKYYTAILPRAIYDQAGQ